jgi:hypothetical protein
VLNQQKRPNKLIGSINKLETKEDFDGIIAIPDFGLKRIITGEKRLKVPQEILSNLVFQPQPNFPQKGAESPRRKSRRSRLTCNATMRKHCSG